MTNIVRDYWHLLIIIAVTLFLNFQQIDEGTLWHSDASRHAMNGVFIYDLISDMPVNNIVHYAREYYEQYPALSLIYHPPLFPVIESIFFAAFGISVYSARMTVLFFSLLFVICWYFFVKKYFDNTTALYSSLLVGTSPYIVLLSRSVLLELPVLTFVILSLFYFCKFIQSEKSDAYFICILFLIASIYTKQTSVFVSLVFLVSLLAIRRLKLIFMTKNMFSSMLFLIALGYYIFLSYNFSPEILGQSVGSLGAHNRFSFESLLYYIRCLPQQLTWSVITGVIGFIIFVLYTHYKKNIPVAQLRELIYNNKVMSVLICYVVICYLFFTLVSVKYPRHTMYWIPILCFFSTLFFLKLRAFNPKVAHIVLCTIIGLQFYASFSYKRPYVSGLRNMAAYIVHQVSTNKIFYNGHYNGSFIFEMRSIDHKRKIKIQRASKKFVDIPIMAEFGVKELITTEEQIDNYFFKEDINYIVIEEKSRYNFEPYLKLRDLLKSEKYNEVYSLPMIEVYDQIKSLNRLILYKRIAGLI